MASSRSVSPLGASPATAGEVLRGDTGFLLRVAHPSARIWRTYYWSARMFRPRARRYARRKRRIFKSGGGGGLGWGEAGVYRRQSVEIKIQGGTWGMDACAQSDPKCPPPFADSSKLSTWIWCRRVGCHRRCTEIEEVYKVEGLKL